MKMVTLTRDMRPFQARDDVFLPDDMAQRLVDAGEAENMRVVVAAPTQSSASVPAAAKGYRTKAKE